VAGKYRLRRRLAIGGMGEVWVARNLTTRAEVALKLLRRGADPDAEEGVAQRLRNEVVLSASLAHRNIVKVYDLVEDDDGTLGLVMELLRGETVFERIHRLGPMPEAQAVAVMTHILDALVHAHERSIVHRDLTPANIFLAFDPDGHATPKLVDFGIAKLMASPEGAAPSMPVVQTIDGRVLGTPMYMAPERIRGDGVDGRSDIFAAAVVLYEMMSGVSPFAASTPTASLAAVLERQVDPDPRIEPRLWLELRRGMAKQPYERHASAREFRDAIVAAVGGWDVAARSLSMTHPPPGWNEPTDAGGDDDVLAESQQRPSSMGAGTSPRLTWLVAAVVAGVAAVTWLATRGASAPTSTSASAAASASVLASAPTPSAVFASAPASPSVLASAPASASARSKRTSEPDAIHAKPVARTPGF